MVYMGPGMAASLQGNNTSGYNRFTGVHVRISLLALSILGPVKNGLATINGSKCREQLGQLQRSLNYFEEAEMPTAAKKKG